MAEKELQARDAWLREQVLMRDDRRITDLIRQYKERFGVGMNTTDCRRKQAEILGVPVETLQTAAGKQRMATRRANEKRKSDFRDNALSAASKAARKAAKKARIARESEVIVFDEPPELQFEQLIQQLQDAMVVQKITQIVLTPERADISRVETLTRRT